MFDNWMGYLAKRIVKEFQSDSEVRLEKMYSRFRTVEALEMEISKLKIEKSQFEEEMNRREREVTHKLGLERIRQEQDTVHAKRELEVAMREKNIGEQEKRFAEQMKFTKEALEEKIASLNVLVEKVFEKIPDVKHETKTIKRISGRS